MTEVELKNEIKSGLCGTYLIAGEEEYLKKYYLSLMRDSIVSDEMSKSFNHSVFSYIDTAFTSISDSLATAPFMQESRLTELSSFNFNSAKESALKELAKIIEGIEDPEESIFIIYATSEELDTSKGSKALQNIAKILPADIKTVIFEKSTPQKLANWAKRHFHAEGIRIDDNTAAYLIEHVGRSMRTLDSEISKLSAFKHAKGEDIVSIDDIKTVCPKSSEIGAFALANSLLYSNTAETFYILGEYKKTQPELKPKVILAQMVSIYRTLILISSLAGAGCGAEDIAKKLTLHEYKAKLYLNQAKNIPEGQLERILSLCIEADENMKSSADDSVILEMLLCRIASECRR